jgi:hypothetical protein
MISVKIIDFQKRNYGRETLDSAKRKQAGLGHFQTQPFPFLLKSPMLTLAKKLKQIHHSYTTTQSYTIFVILSTKTSKFYRRSTQQKAIPFVSTEYDTRENNSRLEKKGFHGNKQQLRKKLWNSEPWRKRERKSMRNQPRESRCKKGAQGMLRAEPPQPKVAQPLFFFKFLIFLKYVINPSLKEIIHKIVYD